MTLTIGGPNAPAALIDRAVALGHRAVARFGREAQRLMIDEEMGELLVAMGHHARQRAGNEAVIEEVADTLIVLVGYCCAVHGQPWAVMRQKLDRLEAMLGDG